MAEGIKGSELPLSESPSSDYSLMVWYAGDSYQTTLDRLPLLAEVQAQMERAEDAADAAALSESNASASEASAESDADRAEAARDSAQAIANGSGDVVYTDALPDPATLADGRYLVISDDSNNNEDYFYTVLSGAVVSSYSADASPNFTRATGTGPFLLVASGQSNAVGRCTGGTFKVNPKVKIWNIGTGAWEVADFENTAYTLDMGSGDEAGNGDNNISVALCHRIQEETGEDVYLVLNAKGGEPISQWVSGGFNTTLKNTVTAALADGDAPATYTPLFSWLQGEKDLTNGLSFADYGTAFETLINDLDGETWFDKSTTPIVTAPISQGYIDTNGLVGDDGVQRFLSSLSVQHIEKYGRTAVASSANLTLCDIAHFDGESMYELGYNRMFYSLSQIDSQYASEAPTVPQNAVVQEVAADIIVAGRAAAEDVSGWTAPAFVAGLAAARETSTVGHSLLALGVSAARGYDTVGFRNIVVGADDVGDMTSPPVGVMGNENTIIGPRCVPEVSIGTFTQNLIAGFAAGFGALKIGEANIIGGRSAGQLSGVTDDNIILGRFAGSGMTDIGSGNVAIGQETLGGSAASGTLGNNSDNRHVAIGAYALSHLSTDNGGDEACTAIGGKAGRHLQSGSDMTSAANVTCVGYESSVSGDNQVQLGNSATTTYAYGAVQDRSDRRDKTDIQPLTDAHIAFFLDIEWVSYRLDYREDYIDIEEYTEEEEEMVPIYEVVGEEIEEVRVIRDDKITIEQRKIPKYSDKVVDHKVVKHLRTRFNKVEIEKDGSRSRKRHHVGAIAQQVEQAMKKHGVDFAGLQYHKLNGGCDVYTLGYQEFIAIQGEIIQRQHKRLNSIEERLQAGGL